MAVAAPPGMLAPITIKERTLRNRIVTMRGAQQRAAAAVHDAADDAVLGVVVGLRRLVRVARQVGAGEALHPLAVGGVQRLAQPLLEQAVVALAVVQLWRRRGRPC